MSKPLTVSAAAIKVAEAALAWRDSTAASVAQWTELRRLMKQYERAKSRPKRRKP